MTRLQAIQKCKDELKSVKAPYVSQESIEDVDDTYQNALEIGWYKDELREDIKLYENMTDEEYDEHNYQVDIEEPDGFQFYHGRDIDGNEGIFEDYEQSIGEA